MGESGRIVRSFFERMQASDWTGAGACLSPTVHVEWPATGETFDGPAFLAMNRAYPQGWSIEVVDIVENGRRVAARVRVEQHGAVFWCAGFYTVADGVIVAGVEHWLTEGAEEPPAWRTEFST